MAIRHIATAAGIEIPRSGCRRAVELAENVQRHDLSTYEQDRQMVEAVDADPGPWMLDHYRKVLDELAFLRRVSALGENIAQGLKSRWSDQLILASALALREEALR